MRVNIECVNSVPLEALSAGDCFIINSEPFMVVAPRRELGNINNVLTVNLSTARLEIFNSDKNVERANGTITLKMCTDILACPPMT